MRISRWALGLTGLVLAGALLRFAAATAGLLGDELFTYSVTGHDSLGGVFDGIRTYEANPPGLYVLTWAVRRVWDAPEAVRVIPLMTGTALIAMMRSRPAAWRGRWPGSRPAPSLRSRRSSSTTAQRDGPTRRRRWPSSPPPIAFCGRWTLPASANGGWGSARPPSRGPISTTPRSSPWRRLVYGPSRCTREPGGRRSWRRAQRGCCTSRGCPRCARPARWRSSRSSAGRMAFGDLRRPPTDQAAAVLDRAARPQDPVVQSIGLFDTQPPLRRRVAIYLRKPHRLYDSDRAGDRPWEQGMRTGRVFVYGAVPRSGLRRYNNPVASVCPDPRFAPRRRLLAKRGFIVVQYARRSGIGFLEGEIEAVRRAGRCSRKLPTLPGLAG